MPRAAKKRSSTAKQRKKPAAKARPKKAATPGLVTRAEAARQLDVAPARINKWAQDGAPVAIPGRRGHAAMYDLEALRACRFVRSRERRPLSSRTTGMRTTGRRTTGMHRAERRGTNSYARPQAFASVVRWPSVWEDSSSDNWREERERDHRAPVVQLVNSFETTREFFCARQGLVVQVAAPALCRFLWEEAALALDFPPVARTTG